MKRLDRFGSVGCLRLVVHHGASPMAYGISCDQYAMVDLPPAAWIEMHEATLRNDDERLASLADPLVEAGYSPTVELVGGSVRQSLRSVPKRWPAAVVLVASPARWLPMRTSGTPVEQLPLLRGRRTVVSALSWY